MPIATDHPGEVGADLVAAAIAARARHGAPVIVVTFGTATAYAAVGPDGSYLGVAIAPGIQISVDALIQRTAKLPQVALVSPASTIGRTTVEALQSGILFGVVGQTEGIVARFRAELGVAAPVVASGGFAKTVAAHTSVIDEARPFLVLEGLAIFAGFLSTAPNKSPYMSRLVKPLQIGPHQIWPPIVLAPMSGVTNRTMRALYKPFGFGLTVTEFVSSNALQYQSKRTMEMIDQHWYRAARIDSALGERPGDYGACGRVPCVNAGLISSISTSVVRHRR